MGLNHAINFFNNHCCLHLTENIIIVRFRNLECTDKGGRELKSSAALSKERTAELRLLSVPRLTLTHPLTTFHKRAIQGASWALGPRIEQEQVAMSLEVLAPLRGLTTPSREIIVQCTSSPRPRHSWGFPVFWSGVAVVGGFVFLRGHRLGELH